MGIGGIGWLIPPPPNTSVDPGKTKSSS